jgi:hypothetical protein
MDKLKVCKVCYKKYDPNVAWQAASHTHQGSSGEEKRKD